MVTGSGVHCENCPRQTTRPDSKSNGFVKLIYFAAVDEGGLSEYSIHQAAALAELGCDVIFLGRQHLQKGLEEKSPGIPFIPLAPEPDGKAALSRTWKVLRWIRRCRSEARQLAQTVEEYQATCVVIASYAEYFAPFWAGILRRIRSRGIRIGSVVHDPVRDFRVGPRWWHQWSVSLAYSFIDVAFVHDHGAIDTGWPERELRVSVIPHGLYQVPVPVPPPRRTLVRMELGIPPDAQVLLSFGHIRDGKNLDLAIRALPAFPNLHLLVVGREQSTTQKPVLYYQQLASELNVSDRCHWVNRFVSQFEVHRYFVASDAIVLLYSALFRSASGVLNNAAQFKLPVLASSGGGPLKEAVESYRLGLWVSPDCQNSVEKGLKQLLENGIQNSNWNQYCLDHDWRQNASLVIESLMDSI